MRVADLTENELLALIVARLPENETVLVGPGDDGAVVTVPDGRMVVSTDVLVQDRHFRLEWSSAADIGHRAAMQNLADVAAMGARPRQLVLTLVAPAHTQVSWVEHLVEGLAQACRLHDVAVVGGDLSGGDRLSVSVAVFGDLAGHEPVLRSGAKAGHTLMLSGVLGHSAAGLAQLRAASTPEVHLGSADELIWAYRRPDPPVADGPRAAAAGAGAMLDVSDGLLLDAGRIAQASGVCLNLDSAVLAQAASELAAAARRCGADPLDWVLSGGEDHGLLASFPDPERAPGGFRRIGSVLAPDREPVLVDGQPVRGHGTGWDHFHTPPV